MKSRLRNPALIAGVLAAVVWWYHRTPEPTVLSFRIGQKFEEVVKNSTYPVMERAFEVNRSGGVFVTEPAVILRFDDPKHGFTLPPTKFAALAYSDHRVTTLSSSPMLEKLPFNEAVAVLENLQDQFKAGGWQPWQGNDSRWFDLTPDGKKRLYAQMLGPGHMQTTNLHIPKKYGMTFLLWCATGCASGKPPYLFLIDVGVGFDTYSWKPGEPMEPQE